MGGFTEGRVWSGGPCPEWLRQWLELHEIPVESTRSVAVYPGGEVDVVVYLSDEHGKRTMNKRRRPGEFVGVVCAALSYRAADLIVPFPLDRVDA